MQADPDISRAAAVHHLEQAFADAHVVQLNNSTDFMADVAGASFNLAAKHWFDAMSKHVGEGLAVDPEFYELVHRKVLLEFDALEKRLMIRMRGPAASETLREQLDKCYADLEVAENRLRVRKPRPARHRLRPRQTGSSGRARKHRFGNSNRSRTGLGAPAAQGNEKTSFL